MGEGEVYEGTGLAAVGELKRSLGRAWAKVVL